MIFSRFTDRQDSAANELDYVELGLSCADICRALDRGMNEKRLNDLSRPVCDAINQLMTWVEPVTCILDPFHLSCCRSQDCRGNTEEGHQTEWAGCSLSTLSCEER